MAADHYSCGASARSCFKYGKPSSAANESAGGPALAGWAELGRYPDEYHVAGRSIDDVLMGKRLVEA